MEKDEFGNYFTGVALSLFNNGDTSKDIPADMEVSYDEKGFPVLSSKSAGCSVSFVVIDYGLGNFDYDSVVKPPDNIAPVI